MLHVLTSVDNEAIRNSRFSNEGNHFVWFRGDSFVSLVDLDTFEANTINALPPNSLPISVAGSQDLSRLIFMTVMPDDSLSLVYW